MEHATVRRTYVAIIAALGATLAADQLARRALVVSGWSVWMTPAGTIRDEPIFRPDPDLEIARNVAWMLAVGLALWLATNAVKRVSSPARQPRWVLVASAGGLAAGTVVGIAAWWLERPGTLVSPGEVGLRAITSELTTILGPLGALVGPPIAYAGHSAWLLLAPPVTYALYGALFGICILMLRAVRALQPNDR